MIHSETADSTHTPVIEVTTTQARTPEDIGATHPTPEAKVTGSGRLFTVPTVTMTIPRAIAGVAIPIQALRGKRTTGLTILAAISDKETPVADAVDKLWPTAGIGRSGPGADLDYKSDFVFGLGSTIAAVFAKKSPPLVRVAAGITGAKQFSQGKWAMAADKEHRAKTGEKLVSKVDIIGKIATAAMMASAAANTVARDMRVETLGQKRAQKVIGVGSVVLATIALGFGETARHRHNKNFRAKMDAIDAANAAKKA